nr:uncharacterized protein LOC111997796 [Quercus suber]XP_023885706.1 uncharacterized protein LOC111997796 [Quercus suber]
MAMMMCTMAPGKLYFLRNLPSAPLKTTRRRFLMKPVHCSPIQPVSVSVEQQVDAGISCEPCNGKGWLTCDFCKGQKTNVKAENNRIYRRCPSCRAIGYILCSKCKVFKCVTFPNYSDGANLSF